jgi:hypothetical protein
LIALETPLKSDGSNLGFTKTSSHIRVTYFDKTLKKAAKQFAYQLFDVSKLSKGTIRLKGATVILEFKEYHLFIIERAYHNDFVDYGNTIRVFGVIVYKSTKKLHI